MGHILAHGRLYHRCALLDYLLDGDAGMSLILVLGLLAVMWIAGLILVAVGAMLAFWAKVKIVKKIWKGK
jgi:hypothetical protein